MNLTGRRIAVTGGASGIGLATVERLVAAGASVACIDVDRTGLEQLVEVHPVFIRAVDITGSGTVSAAIDAFVDEIGGLDGLVNSAGVDLHCPIEETNDVQWRHVMAVNLDGPMHACRAAIPHLKASGGGSIVNVSSSAGLQPLKHRTAYSASKAALQMFSKSLALETGEHDIRVNAVCPGAVDTPLLRTSLEAASDPDLERKAVEARYALRRIASPNEIAAAIVWLLSDEASFVTGTAMAVDGGRSFH